MNDNDQMTESALQSELRDSLSAVATPAPPPLGAITARGHARQRHRLATVTGLSMTGLAAGTALVLGLTSVFGAAPARGTSTIRTAAFTLTHHANGTATLTINPRVISEPSTLQSDLAQYGIPAKVNTGRFCSSSPAPSGFSQVVTFYPPFQAGRQRQHAQNPTITIDPSAMPAGTELSFGIFQPSTGPSPMTAIALIDTDSYTCTSTTPTTLPPSGALLHWPTGS